MLAAVDLFIWFRRQPIDFLRKAKDNLLSVIHMFIANLNKKKNYENIIRNNIIGDRTHLNLCFF